MHGKTISRRDALRTSLGAGLSVALASYSAKDVLGRQTPVAAGGPSWTPPDLAGEQITLWGLQYDPHVERYQMLGEAFTELTGAEVVVQPQPGEERATRILAAIAGGTSPDVVCELGAASGRFWTMGLMMPIDDEVYGALGIDMEQWWFPGAIGAFHWTDGQHYGVPTEDNNAGYAVASRIDLIESTGSADLWPGSDPEGPPWFESYDQMFELAERLQQTGDDGNVSVWGLNSQGTSIPNLASPMRDLGVDWWDPENLTFNMDNDACVQALELLIQTPYDRGIEGRLPTDAQINGFVAGQVALARGDAGASGQGWQVDIEGENVLAPSAVAEATPLYVGEGGWGFQVPMRAPNQDVAVEFLKFVTTYDAQYIFSGMYGGNTPACRAVASSDIFEGDQPITRGKRRDIQSLENTIFRGHGFDPQAADIVTEVMDSVREGRLSPEDAAPQMQQQLMEQLDQWLAS